MGSWIEVKDSLGELLRNRCTLDDLSEIEQILGLPSGEHLTSRERVHFINGSEEVRTLVLLRDFGITSKRSQAIEEVWVFRGNKASRLHPLTKLIKLYANDPEVLKDVALQDSWRSKASGAVYASIEPPELSISEFVQPQVQVRLLEAVSADQEYRLRVVHYLSTPEFVTMLLYREEPKLAEGFDSPVKYTAAREILVQLRRSGRGLLLIVKAPGQLAIQTAIRLFVEELFECGLTDRPDEPFGGYEEKNIVSWFKRGGRDSDGLLVRSIAVRTHNLPGNPVLSVESSPGVDAGKAFADLVGQVDDVVELSSLLDIARVEIEIGENGKTRDIISEGSPSSEVMFKMADNGLTPEAIVEIGAKFLDRFGLPLNQWIDHTKFVVGRTAVYDYLFACEKEQRVPAYQRDTLNALKEQGYLFLDKLSRFECAVCSSTVYDSSKCSKHPDAQLYELLPEEVLAVDDKKVLSGLKDLLRKSNWSVTGHMEHRIGTETYQFLRLSKIDTMNTQAEVWVYPAFGGMSTRDLQNLQSLITPVLIIWIGKGRLSRQAAKAGNIPGRSFGELLVWDETGEVGPKLNLLLNEVRTEFPTRIAQAARIARHNLLRLLIPGPVIDYTPDQFEHDVYVIWKQMLPLSVQLGAKKRGLTVPDGVITFWGGRPLSPAAYLYDAKLNVDGKGYALPVSEQRKAWDYLTKARRSDVLGAYLLDSDPTGYIFISNRYEDNAPEKVIDFVRSHTDWNAPVAFLTVEDLLILHGYWQTYQDQLVGREDAFMKAVRILLSQAYPELKPNRISDAFHNIITREVSGARRLSVEDLVAEFTDRAGS